MTCLICSLSHFYTFLDIRVSRKHLSFRVVGGKVFVTQLGANGAIILPRRSRVFNNRSGEPLVQGEEREVLQGETF